MDFGFTLKPDHTIERTLALDPPGRGGRLHATAGSSTRTSCGAIRIRC